MPMFASRTIAAHLVRGVIAAALIAWALVHQSSDPVLAVAAGVLAVVAMRGCPLCWTIGLVETIGETIKGGRQHTSAPGCRPCS
jgi:nicotinamide riboside transporter PnuC